MFQQLLKVLEELSSYLLDPEGLILAPDTVYLTAEPIQFSFCYLPGEKHSVSNQMKELMEYFLPRLNHREPETVVLGYGLYKIVSDPECSLEQIRSLLSREAEVPVPGEPFAEEKQEAREEQEEMRKKAMESFFAEEEEEEKESVVWTAAVIVGGVVVVGTRPLSDVRYGSSCVHVCDSAGGGRVSVLMVSLWMRKRSVQKRRKKGFPFWKRKRKHPGRRKRNPYISRTNPYTNGREPHTAGREPQRREFSLRENGRIAGCVQKQTGDICESETTENRTGQKAGKQRRGIRKY